MIKWITIFFLLANVGYFGWQMNQRLDHKIPATAIHERAVTISSEPLVLLGELEELPPLREEDVITEIEGDESLLVGEEQANKMLPFNPQGTCLSIGPYESREPLRSLRNWLLKKNMPSKERVEETRTRERYWVYLESKDEAGAKAQLEELKNKGLSDYYMVSKGNMKNAISLGLFSTQDSVNRRLVELKREGYNPVVVPQHKITRIFWLDAQIEDGLTLPELAEGAESTKIDCLKIALLSSDQ